MIIMTIKEIKTKRLTLIRVTGEILEYEINKLSLPNTLSRIIMPENWPHETLTKEVSEIFLSLFKEKRLFSFYWILNDSSGNKNLIRSGGWIFCP
jgi:[ribosomal protein S5]-alanine N-acetyltransferase